MTPKEKALELVIRIQEEISIILARKIALICVDEVINSIEVGYEDFKSLAKINYYQQVKEEINKL